MGTTCGQRFTLLEAKILLGSPGWVPRLLGELPESKAPWVQPIVLSVAGGGRKRPLRRNGLRKQGGRPRWARQGRASTRKRWPLQPAHPRARDRRCLSKTDRDNGQSSTRPSQVVVMPGRLCGESRSGPETWKLGLRDHRKDGHAAGDDARWGKHLAGHTTSSRFKGIRGCARGSNWSHTRRSGPGKRAAFDGAASGSGPGTSCSWWGVKSRKPERRERDRGRQRQVHDLLSRPITPGRGSAVRRARDHAPAGPSRLKSPGNRGRSCNPC